PLTYNSNDSSRSRLLARVFGGKPVEPRSAETQLTRAAAWQDDVAIAFGGSSYLVQWREEEALYAARLGLDGRSLDGRGIELTREKTANGENVVWDGTQYVVSWTERRDGALTSVIRFVSPSQGLLEEQLVGAGLPLTAGPDGVTLLGFAGDDGRLRVRRLFGASRTFENASVAVTPAGERAGNPAAAWNGSEYLVVWNELELDRWSWQFEFWVGARVRGARVSRELTVRDTRPITIGDAPERVDHVTGIASDGSGWLVTWETEYTSIRARRVASDLTLARELFFGTGFGSTVTFDATRYVVGWRGVQPASAVTIADVTRGGALRGIDVVTATEMPGRISLAPGAIAYTRLTRELGGVPRAYVRGLEAVTIRRRAVR
ncbi:MAG TPA: hypothetical protein VHK90_03760, partial [Thermoanaerobaculia bacterium]|nr:hypothetical protein [Thermoanaerobaculia bacterium]